MSAVRISIVIPTQRRPNGLRTAVTSIFRQRDVDFAAPNALYRRSRQRTAYFDPDARECFLEDRKH